MGWAVIIYVPLSELRLRHDKYTKPPTLEGTPLDLSLVMEICTYACSGPAPSDMCLWLALYFPIEEN